MDEESVDIGPIDGLAIPLPEQPFATDISSGSDTYRRFDLQLIWQRQPPGRPAGYSRTESMGRSRNALRAHNNRQASAAFPTEEPRTGRKRRILPGASQ